MDPKIVFSDYFRRMARSAPGVYLARDRELASGEPSKFSPSADALIAFAAVVDNPTASILDLGAGASSFVLRSMFSCVVTYDHDDAYLHAVNKVCVEAGICGWDGSFRCGIENIPTADYTFYDYGTLSDRLRHLSLVISRTRRLVWLSSTDVHEESLNFHAAVDRFCTERGLTVEWRAGGCFIRPAQLAKPANPVSVRRQVMVTPATAAPSPVLLSKASAPVSNIELSVICGTYNRFAILKSFIESVRDSVKGLTYEIVICDGGSTDGSREWLAAQPDVVLVGDRHLDGAVAAFNRAYEMSRGQFVANLNDDCLVEGDALSRGVAFLRAHADVGQVAFAVVSGTGQAEVNTIFSVHYANFGIVRREAAEQVAIICGGFWNPIYRTYAADCEHSAWLHKLGWKIAPLRTCRVVDIRHVDALRSRNEILSAREGRRFYARWSAHAMAPGGFPNVTEEERARFTAVRGRNVPTKVAPARVVDSVSVLSEFDPVEGQFPKRADKLGQERVLHVHLGTPDDPQTGLVRALKQFGAYEQVNWVGVDHGELQDRVLGAATRLKPTLVFMQLQTPDVIDVDTIRCLRKLAPDAVVATWCGDVANRNSPEDVSWQVPLGRAVDLTLHSSLTHVKALREAGVETAAYLQIGYDEAQYCPSPSSPVAKQFDAVFLGNRYYTGTTQNLSKHDGALRDAVVDAFHAAFGARFGAFGSGQKSGAVPLASAHEMYWRAKIGLNVSLVNNFEAYSSDRIFRILGCGCLLLTKRFPLMSSFGLNGNNCVAWDTPEEAVDAVRVVLSREHELDEIAKAGASLAVEHHTWGSRMLELQAIVNATRKGEG